MTELQRQLARTIELLEMAKDDAETDFHTGIAHAEIALLKLRDIVANGKRAIAQPDRAAAQG